MNPDMNSYKVTAFFNVFRQSTTHKCVSGRIEYLRIIGTRTLTCALHDGLALEQEKTPWGLLTTTTPISSPTIPVISNVS